MPAGSFFPLLSLVALASVLQFRNPSIHGTGTSPLSQQIEEILEEIFGILPELLYLCNVY